MRFLATATKNIVYLVCDLDLVIVGCCVLHCVAYLSRIHGWGWVVMVACSCVAGAVERLLCRRGTRRAIAEETRGVA